MRVKQRRLGTALISNSVKARVMIVCICPRKKRTRSGLTAPGCSSISAKASRSCTQANPMVSDDRQPQLHTASPLMCKAQPDTLPWYHTEQQQILSSTVQEDSNITCSS